MISYQKSVTCNPMTPGLDVERNVSNMGEVSNEKGKLSKARESSEKTTIRNGRGCSLEFTLQLHSPLNSSTSW